MRTLHRFLAGAALAALLSFPTLADDNYQGLWWNPAQSGWGLAIAHQRDTILATWLDYDASGRSRWLSLWAARLPDGTYSGTVYETARFAFATLYDPPQVGRTPVGEASLAFRDADHGTLRFSAHGTEGVRDIEREMFGPLPQCTYAAQPDMVNATNYTDTWWAAHADEPGWGVSLAHQGDVIFATWSTYDYRGAPVWLAATAPRIAGNVYGGTLYRMTGPLFGAPFDPAAVARTAAGTATFMFANGNAASFRYTIDGVTGTKALTRELFAPPAGTRCRNATAATIQGRVFEASGIAATVCADLNGNGRCDGGEPATVSDATGAFTLAAGTFTGALVAETFTGYRLFSPGRDYSVNITPYTTLVQLSGERDLAIAEMIVRNELGLPQRFAIRLDAPPAAGSLARSVARSVAAALEASTRLSDAPSLAAAVAAFPPELTELPQLRIWTKDGALIESKEVYVDATFEVANPAAANPSVTLAGKIRGRGNITWLQPKKPYKVQLANDATYAALPDVLGMTKNRNWALLADFMDLALMRNQLVFTLGNSSLFAEGLKWTPATVRVEVWLNGRYDGLYTLTEDVRIDPARLDIARIGASDLDGGYLVEVDMPLDCYNDGTLNLQHLTPHDVHVCVKTPDESAATLAQLAWIKDYLDAAEADLYLYDKVDKLNLVSYVDWYLVNEYIRNWDGPFWSSDYMWKDRAAAAIPTDRLLNMGPLWDFDISAGNANDQDVPRGCWIVRTRDGIPNWYTRLLSNGEFVDLVVARWKDRQAALGRLTDASIAAFRRRIEAAAGRNAVRWPNYSPTDWPVSVTMLRDYLAERRTWMSEAFATSAQYAEACK